MSTLDQADVDVMIATKTCVAAQRFQYDYLNDDITDDGKIDYSITNKVPIGLRQAIADGKKILVLINPPYAEAMNRENTALGNDTKTKTDVASTKIVKLTTDFDYGFAARELFTQFLIRISKEIPTAEIAIFSTLKYVNAPNFEKFREYWSAKYLGGFVVHNKAFEGLGGSFPIGFLIWKTDHTRSKKFIIDTVMTEVMDKSANPIGTKEFYSLPSSLFLSEWIVRPKPNGKKSLPLKNAISPTTRTGDVRGTKWSDGAIGCLDSAGNDPQHTEQRTAVYSSGFSSAGAFYINPDNLWKSAIVFSVRRLIKPTWLNDRDQFLKPTGEITEEFKNDCLIWMLFNRQNRAASANDLEWNNQTWSIVNHFIPFTEAEVNAPGRFESDFMVQYLDGKALSKEATAVMVSGKKLWQEYFAHTDVRNVRDEFKLNRPDVGWYQIRNALKARNASGDFTPVDFTAFESAYKTLSDKLRPQVYELGFLK